MTGTSLFLKVALSSLAALRSIPCVPLADFGFQDRKKMREFVQAALVSVGCRAIRATWGDTELALFSHMIDFCLCPLISLIFPVPIFQGDSRKAFFQEDESDIMLKSPNFPAWAVLSSLLRTPLGLDMGRDPLYNFELYRSHELGQKSWKVSQMSLWSAFSGSLTRGYCFLASLPAPTFCAVRLFMLPLHGIPAQLSGNSLFKCFLWTVYGLQKYSFPHKLMTLLKHLNFPLRKSLCCHMTNCRFMEHLESHFLCSPEKRD